MAALLEDLDAGLGGCPGQFVGFPGRGGEVVGPGDEQRLRRDGVEVDRLGTGEGIGRGGVR
ncbi:MAG: hypothetical protein QOG14_2691 [Mycobacterium sp.]|jgi:hypothetical protein|nr:hypothetical protein [Mycobacterium sp.]